MSHSRFVDFTELITESFCKQKVPLERCYELSYVKMHEGLKCAFCDMMKVVEYIMHAIATILFFGIFYFFFGR